MSVIFAYFDPGAGSLLLQALLGGMGGLVVLWRYACAQLRLRRASASDTTIVSGN